MSVSPAPSGAIPAPAEKPQNVYIVPRPDGIVIFAKSRGEMKEVGFVTLIETPSTVEPHVVWNEYATARNKYEGLVIVFDALKKIKTVIIMARGEYSRFYDSFASKKVIRKVGVLKGIEMEGKIEDVHIYQSERAT
jgi:hypothetical protein